MSVSIVLRRMQGILELVKRKPGISAVELIEIVSESYAKDFSKRTLERDLAALRDEYGVSIYYDRSRRGYLYDEDTAIDLGTLIFLMERQTEVDLLTDALRNARNGEQVVCFEPRHVASPNSEIQILLKAIQQRKEVLLTYRSFTQAHTREHSLQPHILRNLSGRWYVLGWNPTVQNWGTFGLERIEGIETLEKTFHRQSEDLLQDMLNESVGAFKGEPQLVHLRFTPLAAKYVNSLPIHITQAIASSDEQGVTFSYRMAITPDLVSEVLAYGETVQVLKPEVLAEQVKERLQKALQQY